LLFLFLLLLLFSFHFQMSFEDSGSLCSFGGPSDQQKLIPAPQRLTEPGFSAVVVGHRVTISWLGINAGDGDKVHIIVEDTKNILAAPECIFDVSHQRQGSKSFNVKEWGTYRVVLCDKLGKLKNAKPAVFRIGPDPQETMRIFTPSSSSSDTQKQTEFAGGEPLCVSVPVECVLPTSLLCVFSNETGKCEKQIYLKEGIFYSDTRELVVTFPAPHKVGKHTVSLFVNDRTRAQSGSVCFTIKNTDFIRKELIASDGVCRIYWSASSRTPSETSWFSSLIPINSVYVVIWDSARKRKDLWYRKINISSGKFSGCEDVGTGEVSELSKWMVTKTVGDDVKNWKLRLYTANLQNPFAYGDLLAESDFWTAEEL